MNTASDTFNGGSNSDSSSQHAGNSTNSSIGKTSRVHPLSHALPKRPLGPMRSPARVLGWFSIGLGLAELLMPRKLARAAGVPDMPLLTRGYGLREIGVGVGLLTAKDPTPWLWARVAGDALDMATAGAGLVTAGKPMRTMVSLATLCAITYVDVKTAQAAAPKQRQLGGGSYDYSTRSGFPRPAAEMRGAALQPLQGASGGAAAAASAGASAGASADASPGVQA